MFTHSLKFRNFLRTTLDGAEDHYFCAFRDGELVAALPTFLKRGKFGNICNSLPFYGSHGGCLHLDVCEEEIFNRLLQRLNEFLIANDVVTCTIIEPPFEPNAKFYDSFSAEVFDQRIGQILEFPKFVEHHEIEQNLLSSYHQKTRNMVRKSQKSGFEVYHSGNQEIFQKIHQLHEKNILAIGGIPKTLEVFEAIQRIFVYDQDYRIYFATKDNVVVSALLLFYFKDTVEYFCPATLEEYRSQQPLSLLIHSAMIDAISERGSKRWNWGGTWLDQVGVYRFKSRWGSKDFPYKYHVKFIKEADRLTSQSKNELVNQYPNFYTIPFGLISSD